MLTFIFIIECNPTSIYTLLKLIILEKIYNISTPEGVDLLLYDFNRRDEYAYSFVYTLFYDELHYFSAKVYKDTEIVASDLIQDIFMKVWERKQTTFNTLIHIKGYMYISIRNSFREYLSHKKQIEKYTDVLKNGDDIYSSNIIETETILQLSNAIDLLPSECSKVLRLYLEGFDTKTIAIKLNKSVRTVYNQKNEAINILKIKFSNKILSLIISAL